MSWYNPLSWDMNSNANVPTTYADRNQLLGYVNQGMGQGGIANTQAPQLQMGSDPFRAGQLQQMQQLQGIASGKQQGAGELAAQRQMQNSMAAQQAMARSARGGGNGALAYRNAADQTAAAGVTGAGMGQQAALQDQQTAQSQLANVGAAGRQGDYSTANANAGYQQGTNQLNSQNYLGLMNQLGGMDANQLQAANATALNANSNQRGLIGGLMSAGGQIGAAALMSDQTLKTDIRDGGAKIDELLDGMRAYDYKYKDQRLGKGSRPGVMAQDVEKSSIGKKIVRETPIGKALDVNRALSASLAAAARLNERVRKLEGEKK